MLVQLVIDEEVVLVLGEPALVRVAHIRIADACETAFGFFLSVTSAIEMAVSFRPTQISWPW